MKSGELVSGGETIVAQSQGRQRTINLLTRKVRQGGHETSRVHRRQITLHVCRKIMRMSRATVKTRNKLRKGSGGVPGRVENQFTEDEA